ncbi:MAG: 3-phosphoserine/phosphohydroxythreonine transaminase [Burkholderiaceae bacterium]
MSPPTVWNFSAGPAMLPQSVLEEAAAEMLDWRGCGMSVMEMSHRGPEFTQIIETAEADLRGLLAIPDDYRVLFMQGGGVAENAIVPLNLMRGFTRAAFVDTGIWAGKTIREFGKYGNVHVAATASQACELDGRVYQPYAYIPPESAWDVPAEAAYLHICLNETIGGVAFAEPPARDFGVPLVADVSSTILSRPLDVSRFGLLYGGAQKNIGPAGLTLVIVHDSLLDRALDVCPSAFNYRTVADNGSMYNTPPTYAIYIAGLVFQWLKRQGGLTAIRALNQAKARLLYDTLDASDFYANPIVPAHRSTMNVPFRLRDESLNELFLTRAQQRGLLQLKGHKSVGGMRASIYNAMPLAGVQALVEHLCDFEKDFG